MKYGHKGIVELLLEYEADIHATDVVRLFISIYTRSNLVISSNLIGLLSQANAALFNPYQLAWIMHYPIKQKQHDGVNSCLTSVSELGSLRLQENAQ